MAKEMIHRMINLVLSGKAYNWACTYHAVKEIVGGHRAAEVLGASEEVIEQLRRKFVEDILLGKVPRLPNG